MDCLQRQGTFGSDAGVGYTTACKSNACRIPCVGQDSRGSVCTGQSHASQFMQAGHTVHPRLPIICEYVKLDAQRLPTSPPKVTCSSILIHTMEILICDCCIAIPDADGSRLHLGRRCCQQCALAGGCHPPGDVAAQPRAPPLPPCTPPGRSASWAGRTPPAPPPLHRHQTVTSPAK
jgi:hypothetical protein